MRPSRSRLGLSLAVSAGIHLGVPGIALLAAVTVAGSRAEPRAKELPEPADLSEARGGVAAVSTRAEGLTGVRLTADRGANALVDVAMVEVPAELFEERRAALPAPAAPGASDGQGEGRERLKRAAVVEVRSEGRREARKGQRAVAARKVHRAIAVQKAITAQSAMVAREAPLDPDPERETTLAKRGVGPAVREVGSALQVEVAAGGELRVAGVLSSSERSVQDVAAVQTRPSVLPSSAARLPDAARDPQKGKAAQADHEAQVEQQAQDARAAVPEVLALTARPEPRAPVPAGLGMARGAGGTVGTNLTAHPEVDPSSSLEAPVEPVVVVARAAVPAQQARMLERIATSAAPLGAGAGLVRGLGEVAFGDPNEALVTERILQVARLFVGESTIEDAGPREAQIRFWIDARGYVQDVAVTRGSRIRKFDEAIELILHLAEPFPVPTGGRGYELVLPLGPRPGS